MHVREQRVLLRFADFLTAFIRTKMFLTAAITAPSPLAAAAAEAAAPLKTTRDAFFTLLSKHFNFH